MSQIRKKKIAFYNVLSTGHVNLSRGLAKVLLNHYPNEIEIYFLTDKIWQEKLSRLDSRFKFCVFNYEKEQDKNRINDMLVELEKFMVLPCVERVSKSYDIFIDDKSEEEIDIKVDKLINELKPDLLLCDQFWILPSIVNSNCPYGFVSSTSPAIFRLENYPAFGSDAGVYEKKKIEEFHRGFSDCRHKIYDQLFERYKRRGINPYDRHDKRLPLDSPFSDHFPTIYSYPKELDYFTEETKRSYNLWQIDSAILKEDIPPPFQLPQNFVDLPGKLIYVSLGTCFSVYTKRFQRLINILNELPYKYIVSKGIDGDKLSFPSNKFIGENFIDQLAVLQVVDAILYHGGNNTLCEAFYFGVPSCVAGIFGDQINNAKRVVESGYGYSIDLTNYDRQILESTLDKLFNNEELKIKLKKVSERMQKEDMMGKIGPSFMKLLNKL